ncbi:MAG: hypothetical protein AYK23_04785 [Candidatus Proteinoplasmatales archaeon SG8-5]|nr:MAG: hypothetical protein AYK23_04785 [Candidatus Proteinoplasmatales archaeon SG8-5]
MPCYPILPFGAQAQALRIFCAFFRRLIFFLRHFQRCFPRFFQTLELRFIGILVKGWNNSFVK